MDAIKCHRMINLIGLCIILDSFIPKIDSGSILPQKSDKMNVGRLIRGNCIVLVMNETFHDGMTKNQDRSQCNSLQQ